MRNHMKVHHPNKYLTLTAVPSSSKITVDNESESEGSLKSQHDR